jgi:hypothetical protein
VGHPFASWLWQYGPIIHHLFPHRCKGGQEACGNFRSGWDAAPALPRLPKGTRGHTGAFLIHTNPDVSTFDLGVCVQTNLPIAICYPTDGPDLTNGAPSQVGGHSLPTPQHRGVTSSIRPLQVFHVVNGPRFALFQRNTRLAQNLCWQQSSRKPPRYTQPLPGGFAHRFHRHPS